MGRHAIDITNGLDLSRLVEELAANLRPSTDIWHEHGIYSKSDAEALLRNTTIREMLIEAQQRWNSKQNIRERIKSKSLVSIEQHLPDLIDASIDPLRPLNHRVEVWKLLSKLAGIDAEALPAGGGNGVQITIDLSGGTPQVGGQGGVIMIEGGAARATTGPDAEPADAVEDEDAENDDDVDAEYADEPEEDDDPDGDGLHHDAKVSFFSLDVDVEGEIDALCGGMDLEDTKNEV